MFLASSFTVAELKARGIVRGSVTFLLMTPLCWVALYHEKKFPVQHLACKKKYFLDCPRSFVCRMLARAKALKVNITLTFDLYQLINNCQRSQLPTTRSVNSNRIKLLTNPVNIQILLTLFPLHALQKYRQDDRKWSCAQNWQTQQCRKAGYQIFLRVLTEL